MTYEEALLELEEIGVKEKFIEEFEDVCPARLLELLKKRTTINGSENLIRGLLSHYEIDSEKWNYWREIFFHLITPKNMRDKNNYKLFQKNNK